MRVPAQCALCLLALGPGFLALVRNRHLGHQEAMLAHHTRDPVLELGRAMPCFRPRGMEGMAQGPRQVGARPGVIIQVFHSLWDSSGGTEEAPWAQPLPLPALLPAPELLANGSQSSQSSPRPC